MLTMSMMSMMMWMVDGDQELDSNAAFLLLWRIVTEKKKKRGKEVERRRRRGTLLDILDNPSIKVPP